MFRTTKSPTTGPAGLLRVGCFLGFGCLVPQRAQSRRTASVAVVMVRVVEDTEHRRKKAIKTAMSAQGARPGEPSGIVGRFL